MEEAPRGPHSTPSTQDDGCSTCRDRCCSPAGFTLLQPRWEVRRGAALGCCSVPSLRAPCRGWRGGWAEKGVIFKRLLSAQTVIAILCAVPGGWGSRGGLSQLPMSSHPKCLICLGPFPRGAQPPRALASQELKSDLNRIGFFAGVCLLDKLRGRRMLWGRPVPTTAALSPGNVPVW